MQGQGARFGHGHEVGRLCWETLTLQRWKRRLKSKGGRGGWARKVGGAAGRGKGAGSGPDIILSRPQGPAGLDFSAPSLPSPTPGPQILSWGPQGRTALSRPQCVCGRCHGLSVCVAWRPGPTHRLRPRALLEVCPPHRPAPPPSPPPARQGEGQSLGTTGQGAL